MLFLAPPARGPRNPLQAEAGRQFRFVAFWQTARPSQAAAISLGGGDMTTLRRRTAAAALAVAAIGGTIMAVTAAAAPAAAGTTISFTEHNISDRTFNLGSGHGFAVGYVELVANKLMQGGKQVGHDGQSYTVTRLGAARLTSWSRTSRSSPTARSTCPDWSPPRRRDLAPSSSRSPEAPETTRTPRATPPSCQATPPRSPSTSPRDRQPNGPRPARPRPGAARPATWLAGRACRADPAKIRGRVIHHPR